MITQMHWPTLLCRHRLGKVVDEFENAAARTAFQRDSDRITFSSAFRRLQDKTQVYSLARSDYVRTRLTHSLEVASVGRSLGTIAGITVMERHPNLAKWGYAAADFGAIVAAASLAHDIGNPPFGHAGEDVIQEWFANSAMGQSIIAALPEDGRADFLRFEGNAQGLRILVRLANTERTGGLRLTCATLGAFIKYPRDAASVGKESGRTSARKHGYFVSEAVDIEAIADHCGLISSAPGVWRRHPLAFLMEAADDICYRIIDIEDGYRTGSLCFDEAMAVLLDVAGKSEMSARCDVIGRPEKKIELLRAKAIDRAVCASVDAFLFHENLILKGEFDAPLIDHTPLASALNACKKLGELKVYPARVVAGAESARYTVLNALIEHFAGAAYQTWRGGTTESSGALSLLPEQFRSNGDLYERILGVTDFLSGMTDGYAMDFYGRVTGKLLSPL